MKGRTVVFNGSVLKFVAVILIITLILSLAVGCGKKEDPDIANDPPMPMPELNMRDTILYYADANGYVIPVMKRIEWVEGIGKAALNELVAGAEEDIKLASLGLSAPVPFGTEFDLDIADGLATIDILLSKELESLDAERCMISCIVNTLMEFPTVDRVEVLINSRRVFLLENGTEIKEVYQTKLYNLEPQGVDDQFDESFAKLYFISASGKFLVPTSRMLGEGYTPMQVLEALKEPVLDSGLQSVLPEVVEVLDVMMVENQAMVNLSSDFNSLADISEAERLAITAIHNSLTSLEGIDSIQILVEGKLYESAVEVLGESRGFYNILN
jgi:germination protein M